MYWAQLIKRLQDAGVTQGQIGAEVGRAQSTVSDWANGKVSDIPASAAEALKQLAKSRGVQLPAKRAPTPTTEA